MTFDYWHVTCAILVPGILLASWIDYSQRRVPNWLNATLLLLGLVAQAWFFGWSGIGSASCGILLGFSLLIIPWMMHGMGAGDVKLLAAMGAWLGPVLTLWTFAFGVIIGGLTASIMILSTGRLKMATANLGVIMTKCSSKDTMFSEFGSAKSFGSTSQLLPYGVPLTIGALAVLSAKTWGWWGI